MKILNYASERWELERERARQEKYTENSLQLLTEYTRSLEDRYFRCDFRFYDALASIYLELADNSYLEFDNLEMTRGFFYLTAKAGEESFRQYDQHYFKSAEGNLINNRKGSLLYSACAFLANDRILALRLAPEGSPFKALLKTDINLARTVLARPSGDDLLAFRSGYWALIRKNKEKFREEIAKRISYLRRCQGSPMVIDICGLSLIKAAVRLDIICDFDFAEVPSQLLLDTAVDEAIWRLPGLQASG